MMSVITFGPKKMFASLFFSSVYLIFMESTCAAVSPGKAKEIATTEHLVQKLKETKKQDKKTTPATATKSKPTDTQKPKKPQDKEN